MLMAILIISHAHSDAFVQVFLSSGNDIEPYTGFEIAMMAPKVSLNESPKRFCQVLIMNIAFNFNRRSHKKNRLEHNPK